MSAPVTVNPKSYVFRCLGCATIAQSERSDTLTCSNACRVRAHRLGTIKRIMGQAVDADIARRGGLTPRQGAALMVRADAIMELCPDLVSQAEAGVVTFDDLQPEVNRRFIRQVFDEVQAGREVLS